MANKTSVLTCLGVLLAAGIGLAVFQAKSQAGGNDPVARVVLHKSLLDRCFGQHFDDAKLRREMVGTWEMAMSRNLNGTNYYKFPKHNSRLKMWTETNWAIVCYDADSNVIFSASGPYELQGNAYTETIETATGGMTNFLGAHPRFHIRIEDGKVYQLGQRVHEIWRRQEPP
jgi:hypothetical protein